MTEKVSNSPPPTKTSRVLGEETIIVKGVNKPPTFQRPTAPPPPSPPPTPPAPSKKDD